MHPGPGRCDGLEAEVDLRRHKPPPGSVVAQAVLHPIGLDRGEALAALLGTYQASLFLSNLGYKFFWMAFIMVALYRSASYLERAEERETAELDPVS